MLARVIPPGQRQASYAAIQRFFVRLAKPPGASSRPRLLDDPLRLSRGSGIGVAQSQSRLRHTSRSGSLAEHWQHARSYSSTPPPPPPRCADPSCPHEPTRSRSLVAPPPPSPTAVAKARHPSYLDSLPASLRRLAATLPAPAGRPPSRDQLLALTTSFFERLKIRFKWATIRSYRHYRADDYSAFFSFGILGTLGWFLISTTSFFAFCFLIINSLSLQEWFAGRLGDYLTAHTGVTVVFESAIVPKWGFAGGSSKIVFKNVYLSRGPTKAELGVLPPPPVDGDDPSDEEIEVRDRMAKWTHFHLSIDTVEVSLSLARWLDGKGLVKEAAVTGVRGVVDRSHVIYDPDAPRDRFAYRHVAQQGDFFLENLQIEDFLVTVYQPDHFRPYTFSIFNADIRKLRKQWLFYDLLSADSITGQVDNCLFSLHKPQSIGRTSESDLKDAHWARMSRFRIDGVPIDHMQTAHDSGVLSWVTSGRCDLVADIRFPREGEQELDLSALVADIVDKFGEEIGQHLHVGPQLAETRIPGRGTLSRDALEVPKGWGNKGVEREKHWGDRLEERVEEGRDRWRGAFEKERAGEVVERGVEHVVKVAGVDEVEPKERTVSIDLDIRFKDLKAHVPFFTTDISYVNNALIRPIVAFINSNRTLIPIRCHLDLPLSDFDGSWTTYDVGLLDRISEQTYAALAYHVQNANNQRLQTVSLWTLQMTANAVLAAFRNNLAY